jgi:hypothetical protein
MEAWRARLANARATFLEDDEVSIAMALGQLESAVHGELQPPISVIGGSSVGKAKNIERARVIMDERMHLDYFCDELWGPAFFRRRFRMRRSLFLTILERVYVRDPYFVQKRDTCGLVGLSSRQKMTAALRMLSGGVCANVMDDYCRTSESTAIKCMKHFCSAICHEFGEHHLRQPTRADFEQQLAVNAAHSFPGMLGH